MGRSVETISYATETVFLHPEIEFSDDWDLLVDDLHHVITEKYPSLDKPRGKQWMDWPCHETRILLENDHCRITLSEYCGIVALSLVPKDYNDSCYSDSQQRTNAASGWCKRIASGFAGLFTDRLQKIGTFSNGESVFERIKNG